MAFDDLDAQTRQQISDRLNSSNQLTGDYEQDQAKGLFKPMEPDSKYDFGMNAESSAIANKARQKFYDPIMENATTQQKAGYAEQVQKKIQGAQRLAMGQLRYDNARALAAHQRVAQEEAQRAAFIGSLFQVGGTVGGAMLGGPSGAMIGSQVGGAVGGSAAGAQGAAGGSAANPGGGGYMNTAGRTA